MHDWLREVLDGSPTPAAIEHVQRGVQRWIRSAGRARRDSEGKLTRHRPVSLAQCLGLNENPMLVRRQLRDHWLREAARALEVAPGTTHWGRSGALAEAVRAFVGHQWLCWYALSAPPPNASELHRTLFFAMRAAGEEIPRTPRGLHKILSS